MPDYCFTPEEDRERLGFTVQVTGWLALRQKKNRAMLDSALVDLASVPHCMIRRDGTASVWRKNKFVA